MIWSDDFEGFNVSSSWSFECIEGKSVWKHSYAFGITTDKKPEASSGYGYIMLAPENDISIGGNNLRTINRLITPSIDLNKNSKYYLTGYYRIYDVNKLPSDTLKILFRSSESSPWNKVGIYTTLERNHWKKFTIGFTNYESLQIAFEGHTHSNALMFLDNLVLIENEDSDIDNIFLKQEDEFLEVYSLSGIFIGYMKMIDLKKLPSGIYVLRNKLGIKKIVR